MPKSDTWPGGVAMEPLSHLDSAGSCDSVISMNSAYSEDSMEHLSADERACLMYLEETIEALEQQEDSGLSNDEPDPGFQADTKGQMRANYISSFKSDEFGKDQTSDSGSIEDKAEHHALSATSEPQSSNTKDLQTSVNLMTQPEPPATELVTDCKIHPTATQLSVFTDGYGQLKIVPSASLSSGYLSEMDTVVIPPPSDFMDEPVLPKQPRDLIKDLRPSARVSNKKPGATVDLEQLCQRASVKRTSLSTSVTQERPNKPPDLSLLTVSSGPLMSPPPEAAEPRSPPVVAPKPKMLPANILLKPHKAGSDGYSSPTSSDRLLLDHQRVRMEALRKLGLLPAEGDSSPVLSPDASPTTRKSWTAPASPISPLGSHTPPFKPRYNRVDSSPGTCVPLHSPATASPLAAATAPAVQPDEVLPAPAAFSDPVGPPLSDNELSDVKDASEVNAQVNTPPLTPSAMIRHLTPQRFVGVKSAIPEPPPSPSAMIKHLTPPRFVGVKSASPEPPPSPSAMIKHLTPQRFVGVKSASPEPPPSPSAMIKHLTPPRFVGVKSASPEPPLTPCAMIKHLTPPRFVGVKSASPTPPPSPSAMIKHLTPPRFVGVKSASPEPPLTPSAMIRHLTPPRCVGVKSASPEPPINPSAMVNHLTQPRFVGVKSATLERSGLGLSSLMASQDSNKGSLASQLRNNRARPASLGGGTEFTRAGGEGSQMGLATSKEPDLRRSLPAHTDFQSLGDSPNLPRSEGISVLICPKAENGEDRRNALKKLGLLRD